MGSITPVEQELRKPVDLTEPLSAADFEYFVSYFPGDASVGVVQRDVVRPALKEADARFGITAQELPWGRLPNPSRPAHCLVVTEPGIDLSRETEAFLASLTSIPEARVNVVSSYPFGLIDPGMSGEAEATVRRRDAALGVNTLFPSETDALYYALRTVPMERIVDNLVCETFRAKCLMERNQGAGLLDQLAKEQQTAAAGITATSNTFKRYALWHRAPTDGAVMLPTAEGGWLVSQAKTSKTEMTAADFSLISGFAEPANLLRFAGRKIPSSDSPELLILLAAFQDQLGESPMAIHFHENGVTRGGTFPDKLTRNAIEYGQFESGHEILYELLLQRGRTGESWVILRDHGVVWLGETPAEFEDFVANRLQLPVRVGTLAR